MESTQLREQISAAHAYEELFVPALFQPWAPLTVQAANIGPGDDVLDVACGTGVVTREAARLAGASARIAGLDLTPGMLAVAETITPDVEWQHGNAIDLPFPDQSFDAVVSQFGLMFFPDRGQSLREMRRVLRPGGRVAVTVWDDLDNNPTYAQEVALLNRMAGQAAADAIRIPYVLGNTNELEQMMRAAGFADIRIETSKDMARFPNIQTAIDADLRGWLPIMGVILDEPLIQAILAEAEQIFGRYVNAKGEFVFPVSAHIIRATR